ncbi:DSBA-like thioredoxin domain-containing protein [Fimicolochytrium jonesii]|uniref:DSBA-like thioredoxin domain-containing protein n=1 Tax=Fimicolochytrium jonesii TaxID=1396493 RepID=UPI0022FE773B|nr:DSBA-like thioredoxin domain-containing protein [Fimicolochytrium jonesii]KAI8823491.1 DSBA-like thioredoxin domain-containing protein [Fimicolochytrium jonesii]
MAKRLVTIDVISDTVCPFCFLGKRRLERAMARFSDTLDFKVRWHPFYLDPTATVSKDKLAHYHAKFGEERFAALNANMKRMAAAEGININFGGLVGPTRDSHRLTHFAQKINKQDEVIEGLFKAYFEDNKDIADVEVLTSVASGAGINGDEARQCLLSGEGGDEVDQEANKHRRSINGVPHFTVNGKHEIHGAQDVEEFVRVFRKVEGGN